MLKPLPAICAWSFLCFVAFSSIAQELAVPESLQLPSSEVGLPGAGPIRNYEEFKELWEKRRAAWAQRVEDDQHALVFLGDSITQAWRDDFRGHFSGVKVANRGISGDTTRGMLIRLADDVLALNPIGVVMLMGTNDLEEQATPETIAGNVRLILKELKKHDPEMPVVLCRVFPSSASKKRPRDKIQRVNDLLAEAVKGDPQVTLLDTWTLFKNDAGDARAEDFPDLLHLNNGGYTKWANALRPVFATLGFLETEADSFEMEPGFVSLFNGRDLTGWCFRPTTAEDLVARKRWQANQPNAPPWPVITERVDFDNRRVSPDERFAAIHGRLVVKTPTEGRRIQQIWTTQEFADDFVFKMDFRATPNADSGVFIRGRQLQCRDFLLAGPYKELRHYRPQQWNELDIRVSSGIAHCSCNGEVLEAEFKVPESGPIGLEGDRGQLEYRRIRYRPGR